MSGYRNDRECMCKSVFVCGVEEMRGRAAFSEGGQDLKKKRSSSHSSDREENRSTFVVFLWP